MADVEALVKEAKARAAKDDSRMQSYERCRAAYFNEDEGTGSGGVEAMDSAGRITLRAHEIRTTLRRRQGKVNLLTPIVDDYVSLRGVMPTIKVLPEDEGEQAKEDAVKRTRIVRANLSNSDMDTREMEAAWFLTDLGDCLYTLTPVFEDEPFRPMGIYVGVVDPAKAYPRFRQGVQRDQLDDVFIVSEISREQAEAEYGVETTKKSVSVIHYFGREENVLIVDELEITRVQHNLGFCPAEWARNKQTGGRFAQSDVAGVIDQHNELQVMAEVMKDAMVEATYSQLLVKDPVNVQEQFEVGPGAPPIVVQGTGDARRIPPSPPPQAAEMIIDRQWQNIQHQTGSAPIRTEGRIGGSNISARAINQAQGPMETRLGAWQVAHGQTLQRIAGKILLMFHALKEFREQDEITIWGTEKGKPQKTTFTSEELNGWWRCAVNYGAMIGSSNHEKAVVGLQLMSQSLVPAMWVLEQIGVDDPETLIKEAESEHMRRAQMAQQAQGQPGGPAQNPEQAQSQIQQPAEQGQSLAAGSTGNSNPPGGGGPGASGAPVQPPPPPAMPGFAEMAAAPGARQQPPPAMLMASVSRVTASLAPRLRGQILGAVPQRDGRIKVEISDSRDGRLVGEAFRSAGLRIKIEIVSNGHVPA